MMFGFRDEFTYLECENCGSLQIAETPADLARYYPPDYHSFQEKAPGRDPAPVVLLKSLRARHLLGAWNPIGALVARCFGVPEYYRWLQGAGALQDSEILDVGSGTGRLLFALRREGLARLTGIDPYVEQDLAYPNGIRIWKRSIEEMDGEFDLLMFHHSLEHVPDPLSALREARRLLRPGRFAVVRLPVAGSWAWREYRECWLNLDPPRHLWLPTPLGMRLLAERAGLALERHEFDSADIQFWGSELYRRGIPMNRFSQHYPPEAEVRAYLQRAGELNRAGEGDQATFYLRRPDD